MTFAAALFVVFGFLALVHLLKIAAHAGEVLSRSRRALADVRNHDLDELTKERAIQGHAIRLFGLFGVVTGLSAVALAVPLGVIALAGALDWLDFDAVVDRTLDWDFLLIATVLATAVILALRHRRT